MIEYKIKRPLGDRLVIKRDKDREKTESGILIPEQAQDRPHTGFVVSVGPDVKELKPKLHVLYGKYSGTELLTPEGELLLLREAEVMAILD